MATICATLIVRNERHVVDRTLRSVLPYITHWAVVDTGSDDGTQDLIASVMNGIPGKLLNLPWKGFAASRNDALALARSISDYALFIDADDVIDSYSDGPPLLKLTEPLYYWWAYDGSIRHRRVALVRHDVICEWRGKIHEQLHLPRDVSDTADTLSAPFLRYTRQGARGTSDSSYDGDVEILLSLVKRNPSDVNSRFYLARTLHWRGDLRDATQHYQLVADSESATAEERWLSGYEIAKINETLGLPLADLAIMFSKNIVERPGRAEPYVSLACALREMGKYQDALSVAEHCATLPLSSDSLFVDVAAYGWRAWDEICINAIYCGDTTKALSAAETALACPFLPDSDALRIRENVHNLR
jgi:glycosyltransferase involved in cell wall biosynthesis